MMYNEFLEERISQMLDQKKVTYERKKMMGGLTFMVNEKMCIGIVKDQLMARIGPDIYSTALQKKGCRQMVFTGKPMIGYVYVEAEAIDLEEELEYWVQLCLNYNPSAKSSKKK